MEAIIPIIERLGSLGILVLMVWRAPNIIAAITSMIDTVTTRVASLQDRAIEAFKEQQDAERSVMVLRFENLEKGLEKVTSGLDASMRGQTAMIQVLNKVSEELPEIRHRLERLEGKQ